MAWVSPEGETSKSPEVLEQTMRRVLKSELEAQTDRLRQQINEDVSLHFAEQSVEAISKKAQELLEASITLESSLRDHKEFLQNLVNPDGLKSSAAKTLAPKTEPGMQKNISAKSEMWTEGVQDLQASDTEREDQKKKVVPAPHVPSGHEEAAAPGSSAPTKLDRGQSQNGGRKNVLAEDFMKEVEDESEDEFYADATTSKGQSLRGKARYLLSRQWFDMTIGSVIILNSVVIGVQADWNVQHIGAQEPEFFGVSEKLFGVIFTGELLLRIYGFGFRRFYCGPDWKWAVFDTFIVSMQIFEEISSLFVDDAANGNLGFMRVIRILRLLRIMRLVRILQFVNELRTMVMSVANSMRSLVWTILLMLLMMYIIGVYLCQLIADTGAENPSALSTDLMTYYGSLPRAVLSMYQAMTGGVDWNDLASPLETSISPIMSLVFALYIAFAVLAMMNVVTGVFVESALGSAREDREREVIHAVRKIFNMGDQNRNGVLSWAEFSDTLEDPSNSRYFSTIGINASEARGLFNLLDADDSGSISVQEFIQGCLRLRGQAKAIDLATLIYMTKRMVYWLQDRLEYVESSLERIMPPEKKTPRPSAIQQKGELKRFLDMGSVHQITQVKESRGSIMGSFTSMKTRKTNSLQGSLAGVKEEESGLNVPRASPSRGSPQKTSPTALSASPRGSIVPVAE